MATLIFITTVVSFLFLAAKIVLHLMSGKDIVVLIRMLLLLLLGYAGVWMVFHAVRVDKVIPLGVDNCFDDWCAMVTGAEYPATLGRPSHPVQPQGQWVLLYVRLSNPARAAQLRESQPRVFLLDASGHEWSYSPRGQAALMEGSGSQMPLVNLPGMQRDFETELVFDVPKDVKGLRARIDNGPGVLRWLMLPEGREVVALP
jgi:hypothetical protein